jgi:hypothetical protein
VGRPPLSADRHFRRASLLVAQGHYDPRPARNGRRCDSLRPRGTGTLLRIQPQGTRGSGSGGKWAPYAPSHRRRDSLWPDPPEHGTLQQCTSSDHIANTTDSILKSKLPHYTQGDRPSETGSGSNARS